MNSTKLLVFVSGITKLDFSDTGVLVIFWQSPLRWSLTRNKKMIEYVNSVALKIGKENRKENGKENSSGKDSQLKRLGNRSSKIKNLC